MKRYFIIYKPYLVLSQFTSQLNKQTLANYKKNYPDKETMGKLVFTIIKKEKLGNENYLVIGKWHITRSKDEVGGHFSLVWKKISGQWVIISDHTS